MFGEFFQNETGAVTVDWVVLTAATVGLGLASVAAVTTGVEDLTGDTVAAMDGASLIRTSFVRAVTENWVADAILAPGETFNELRNATSYSFRMDATLDANAEGILYEAGGTGSGTILYQYDGKLYLQAGNGGSAGAAANRGEAIWDVSDGDYVIEGSLDASTGLALYVDGEMVSQSSFSTNRLAGGNDGMVGDGNNSVARNHGGFVQGDTYAGAGDMSVFVGQTTGDEGG